MRGTYIIFLSFLLSQVLSVFTLTIVSSDYLHNSFVQSFVLPKENTTEYNIFFILFYIFLSAFLLLLFFRLYKGRLLFYILSFSILAVPSSVVFYSFLRLFLPIYTSTLAGILIASILSLGQFFKKEIRPFLLILSCAGVGAVLGFSLGFWGSVLLLFFLSLYDYISVFKTKHMVEMAKVVVKKDLPLSVSGQEEFVKITPEGKRIVERRRLDLGTGDLVGASVLTASSFLFSPFLSVFSLLGTSFGLLFTLEIVKKKRLILPALPPIFLSGFLFTLFGIIILSFFSSWV